MIILSRIFAVTLALSVPFSALADNDGPAPPKKIHSYDIAEKVSSHAMHYMHPKYIGACLWFQCHSIWDCHVHPTAELDEYLPDLVVTVYSGKGNDPYWEANLFDKAAYPLGNTLMHVASGVAGANLNADLSNGRATEEASNLHSDALRTKSVDVIGSPMSSFSIPFTTLRQDTTSLEPYYQSDDDTLGRLGIAELLRYETYLPTHSIGEDMLHHWGYEFPRTMTINVDNGYKAAVIAALHAVDLVTNNHTLHTLMGTNNSCGENCVASNVIEEDGDEHSKWQEVFPNNHELHPGEKDTTAQSGGSSMGADDENAGNGNYVFVVWRHYKGCIQAEGKLIYKTKDVGYPIKR